MPGNSQGFTNQSLDLSSLSTTTYGSLMVKIVFETSVLGESPWVDSLSLSWVTQEGLPLANIDFNLLGSKIVGFDAEEQPILKYSGFFNSGEDGAILISSLEWDNYKFSLPATSSFSIKRVLPSNPVKLDPDVQESVKVYLDVENALTVTVKDKESLDPIPLAEVRIYDDQDFDETLYTNEKGQVIFVPLQAKDYHIEINAESWSSVSTTVSVLGKTFKSFYLERVE